MLARPRWALAALLAIIGLSSVFVSVHVASYHRLSPVDELSHLDYVFRSPALLAPGDKVEQQALYEQACRGVDAPGFDPVLCDRNHTYDADAYQEKGFNTAANFTPIYYASTRAVAEVIRALTPANSLFVAARLTGAVWLALGLVLTFLAGRRAGVAPAPLLAVLALLIASPSLIYPSATVTPDAVGLAGGAAVVLAALAWERRPDRRRLAVLVLVGVIFSLVKLTNILVLGAVALFIVVDRSRRAAAAHRADADDAAADVEAAPAPAAAPAIRTSQRWTAAGLASVAALFAAAAWTVFSNSRNHADPDDVPDMTIRFAVTSFPWSGMLDSALTLVSPLSSPWVAVGTPSLLFFTTSIVSLVLTAGTVGAALFSTTTPRVTVMARCLLVVAVLGSLGLVTMNYVTAHQYFALPARYGQSLIAPMVLVTAAMLRSRVAVGAVTSLAVVALVMTSFRIAGIS